MNNLKFYEATFWPQAWIRNYAVEIDPHGPTRWIITPEYLDKCGPNALKDNTYDSDQLRYDPAAPRWVVEWPGPFYITTRSLEEYEAHATKAAPSYRSVWV